MALFLKHFGITDIGRVRSINQDCWQALPEDGLFAVADGMGGRFGGEVASYEAMKALVEFFKKRRRLFLKSNIRRHEEYLSSILSRVNGCVYGKGLSNSSLKGMGTTLCTLHLCYDRAVVAHVGDSRVYCYREGSLYRLTEDHSLLTKMMNKGMISPESIEKSPYKHILTHAIGTKPNVPIEVNSFSIKKGDLFLLCSDGLTNFVSDSNIENHLSGKTSLEICAKKLIEAANNQGGGDNITTLLVEVG
ncbi:Protein phosphatase PrpC [Candidatus Clavichlamydia salmonicola]|uniref:Stp1/IreP family PP2C-type Ser/Thr phosphatase n=1 Tax=Candidatus Clavichlamydia salmonicola TaxID=469812 RepID=UPI001891CB2D|nr:Stp1/IreP family PP2C-type Ser/Thr phosphatase [Candidatus Clavichlamydia salmonicola]MBF5051140.1 Protein phosphatase PrpC [Candidatus Clavichlamydia salmonicola]